MEEKWILQFDEEISPFSFYESTLKKLHEFFTESSTKKIHFDFSKVEFINPLVIPNLLTVGIILKNYFKEPQSLFIPWKPKILSYLSDMRFFEIVDKYQIFDIDEGFVGGYGTGTLDPEYAIYAFDQSYSYSDIWNELIKSKSVIGKIAGSPGESTGELMQNLLNLFSEICLNALEHSESLCFALFQTKMGRNVKYKKAYLSISDGGIGLYNSLIKKIKHENFKTKFIDVDEFLKEDEVIDFVSILEAIYYRKEKKIYGLYDAVSSVIEKNGIFRLHSNTSQLIFNSNNFKKFIHGHDNIVSNIKNKLFEIASRDLDVKYSMIRKNPARFKGVHIEVEVPLN